MDSRIDESLFRRGTADEILAALSPLVVVARADQAARASVETLLRILVPPLVYLRDEKRKTLNLGIICDAASFDTLVSIAYNESVPPGMRDGIVDYLYELPGFVLEAVDENGGKSDDPIYEKLDIDIPRQQQEYYRSFLLKSFAQPAVA
jgi:hypothetical protein